MSEIKTKPQTKEWDEGYERIFGKKEPERGRWIQDPVSGQLIPADEYQRPAPEARFAPVMVDRFYENTCASDGTDIGSRKKHREYMRQNGLTTIDDFTNTWKDAAKTREKIASGEYGKKERREAIARAAYQIEKRDRARRNKR